MKIYDYHEPDSKIKLYLRQLLTALGPLMAVIVSGMSNGYSAILLPQLKAHATNSSAVSSDRHFGQLTLDQESWIAAAAVLPMAPGCWTGGAMAERLGRKTSVMLLLPVFFVSWLVIGLAGRVETLVAGRLLTGYCMGILAPIVPIYVGETSDPRLRGVLLSAISLCLSIGILACHTMGTWLHWRTTAYACSTLPLICWIVSLFSCESPMWLLGRGKFEQAKLAWIFFRGEHSLEEFFLLETSRLVDLSKKNKASKKRSFLRSIGKTWSSRCFLKPFAIMCLYFFTTQFAGANVMAFYCVQLLTTVSGLSNVYLITILIDIIRLTVGIVACALVKTYSRRSLTFLSGFGVAVTMLTLSACLMLNVGGAWLPVALLVVYIGLLPLGLIPIPWLLCGELFARKHRGLGSGLTSGFAFMSFFVVIKTTPAMTELIKPEGTFAVYGAVAFLGTGILYFVLPETGNKTLQEIQVILGKRSRKQALKAQLNEECEPIKCDSSEKSNGAATKEPQITGE